MFKSVSSGPKQTYTIVVEDIRFRTALQVLCSMIMIFFACDTKLKIGESVY